MSIKTIQKRLLEKLQGDVQTEFSIEFQPDRTKEEEKYLLTGTQAELRSQISLLMAFRSMIEDLRGGDWFEKYEQFVWENPAPLCIQIHWRINPNPPFEPGEMVEQIKLTKPTPPRPYVTLAVKREALTWANVKAAAGGSNGRMWGPHYAVARMKFNDQGLLVKAPPLKVYGASKEQAIADLEALMSLTPDNLYTMTGGEEIQDKGARLSDPGFRKPKMRVYPAWFFVINWELVDAARREPGKNRSTTIGKMLRKAAKIELWQANEPLNAADKIRQMLSRSQDL